MNFSAMRRLTDEINGVLKFCFVVAIAGLFLFFIFLFLSQWMVNHYDQMGCLNRLEYTKAVDDYMKTLAQIVGGAALLGGLYVSWRNIKSTEDGRITDRFSKAVEQLGSCGKDGKKQYETRLGAIYALERISIDSNRDRQTIVNILCAYVRVNAPRVPEFDYDETGEPFQLFHRQADPDIQAALLAVKKWAVTRSYEIDLHGAELFKVDFSQSRLCRANLYSAYMEGADLSFADLNGANLAVADLSNTDLSSANLSSADLSHAIMRSATLKNANLNFANLSGVDLRTVSGLTQRQLLTAKTDERTTRLPHNMPEV